MTSDLWVSYTCLTTTAAAATAVTVWLAVTGHPWAAAAVAWTVPSLLVVAAAARSAHHRTRKGRA